jgi:hypothetical protein
VEPSEEISENDEIIETDFTIDETESNDQE